MAGIRRWAYAGFIRVIAIGVVRYLTRSIPKARLAPLAGFVAGFYIDAGLRERKLDDNFLAGLVLAGLLYPVDVRYSLTRLVPEAYKAGFLALGLAAIALAGQEERKRGRPARIPAIGTLAVLAGVILLIAGVQPVYVNKTRAVMPPSYASRAEGTNYTKRVNTTTGVEALTHNVPVNGTGTLSVTFTAPAGYDALKYAGIVIRTKDSNRTRVPGVYHFEVIRNPNVTATVYIRARAGGQAIASRKLNASTGYLSYNRTVTTGMVKTLKLADRVNIEIGFSSPASSPVSIAVSRTYVEELTRNKAYGIAALGALALAVIDAIPDIKTGRRRRR